MSRSLVAGAVALLLAACATGATGGTGTPTPPATTSTGATGSTSPAPFDPAASAQVFLPYGDAAPAPGGTVPVVVLVPGGGWQTHDSSGLVPLAQDLADAGSVAVTTEYRAGQDGVGFPDTLHDVLCSAAYAVAQAKTAGYAVGTVTLVGHSAGGHLVALAGVSDGALAGPCADPVPGIDGVVGLAGIYDVRTAGDLLGGFFGGTAAELPAVWDAGNPTYYVEEGTAPKQLRVLLIHGEADDVVPLSQSQDFAAALEATGIDVELDVLPDEDHMSVFTVGVVSELIQTWLAQG